MSHVNTKLRASILAALLTFGLSTTTQASFEPGGSASSDAVVGEYNAMLVAVGRGRNVEGLLNEGKKTPWAGVIKLELYNDDGEVISTAGTFCTDIHHPTDYKVTYETSNEKMSCELKYLVNTYPAALSGITSTEAAARQSAVWHFADGFVLTSPEDVVSRKAEIVADVKDNASANCSSYEKPLVLTVSTDTVSAHEGDTVTYTVSAKRDGQPVSGKQVSLKTSFGALNATTVATDEYGEATFTVAASGAGTATVAATATYTMPAGIIFHALDLERQKLLLADSQKGSVTSHTATVWQPAEGSITVNIFHDRNMDGEDATASAGEEDLAGWTVKLLDSDGEVIKTTGTDANGLAFFNNVPNGDYTVTYDLQTNWMDTNGNQKPASEPSVSETITVDNDSHYEDMGVIRTPFVDVCVFIDNNQDGEVNAGEDLLAGWDVELYRENGSAVVGASGTTDADGTATLTFHRISDFTLGGENYFTALIEKDAWKALQDAGKIDSQGVATSDIFTLADGMYEEFCQGVKTFDCNDVVGTITVVGKVAEGTVKVHVGSENAGEEVKLIDEQGNVFQTTEAGDDGSVTFSEVPKGEYTITLEDESCGRPLTTGGIEATAIDLAGDEAVDGE